jgi:DNA-binding transcriptional regulator GbsR (MarR family)
MKYVLKEYANAENTFLLDVSISKKILKDIEKEMKSENVDARVADEMEEVKNLLKKIYAQVKFGRAK